MILRVVLFVVAALAAWLITAAVRRYASRRLLDIPNDRSSHARPVPRGGGLSIVVVVGAFVVVAWILHVLDAELGIALTGGGLMVASIGWLDDHGKLTTRTRFVVQVIAAVWVVYWLRGMPIVHAGNRALHLGGFGSLLAVLWIVWLTNLYNFMDGIDGIAALNAVTVALFGALLENLLGGASIATLLMVVAGASVGFLLWNWEPARIFMGDVGSGFLGFVFGVISVASNDAGSLSAVTWVILLGVFIVDATITLLRRAVKGEKWYAAHRSHAYQRAVSSGRPHARVTIVVGMINLALAVLAFLTVVVPEWTLPLAALAAVSLVGFYLFVESLQPMWSE